MPISRRNLLFGGAPCEPTLDFLHVESGDSPFFEHYHLLSVPVSSLVKVLTGGIRIVTTHFDEGSYDKDAFERFVASSGLNRDKLLAHTHEVHIAEEQLRRIARGEKRVEVRVVSAAGNYVHNFEITASTSALVKVRRRNLG